MDVRYAVGRNEYRRMTTEALRAASDYVTGFMYACDGGWLAR